MDSYPYNIVARNNRRENEPFMLNGDAHVTLLVGLSYACDRCEFSKKERGHHNKLSARLNT